MARAGIFGASGKGKSWFFGWYLERVVPDFDYAVHFDKEDEERGLSKAGEDPIFRTFFVDEEFLEDTVVVQGKELPLVYGVVLKNKKVRVVPDGLTPDENRELFAQLCHLAMQVGEGPDNFHVSADEAHEVVSASKGIDERVTRMLTGGRKKGVEWALCTQRPAKLHEDAYTQMNYGVYFGLSKDNDRSKVNGSTGFDAYHALEDLKEREAIVENADTGNVRHINTNDLERERPHVAKDDGIADAALEEVGDEANERYKS